MSCIEFATFNACDANKGWLLVPLFRQSLQTYMGRSHMYPLQFREFELENQAVKKTKKGGQVLNRGAPDPSKALRLSAYGHNNSRATLHHVLYLGKCGALFETLDHLHGLTWVLHSFGITGSAEGLPSRLAIQSPAKRHLLGFLISLGRDSSSSLETVDLIIQQKKET